MIYCVILCVFLTANLVQSTPSAKLAESNAVNIIRILKSGIHLIKVGLNKYQMLNVAMQFVLKYL